MKKDELRNLIPEVYCDVFPLCIKVIGYTKEIKEKVLVTMMNQIPKKYHNNLDKIAEFTDIISNTIDQTIQDMREAL